MNSWRNLRTKNSRRIGSNCNFNLYLLKTQTLQDQLSAGFRVLEGDGIGDEYQNDQLINTIHFNYSILSDHWFPNMGFSSLMISLSKLLLQAAYGYFNNYLNNTSSSTTTSNHRPLKINDLQGSFNFLLTELLSDFATHK